jgi:hypothetical protein
MNVEGRLAVQRTFAMPIECRGADAALRFGFGATRRVFEGAHALLTPVGRKRIVAGCEYAEFDPNMRYVPQPYRRRNPRLDIAYAGDKFAAEPYPFAPALRPIREALAKLDPKPKPEPLRPRKAYVPSLMLAKKNRQRR